MGRPEDIPSRIRRVALIPAAMILLSLFAVLSCSRADESASAPEANSPPTTEAPGVARSPAPEEPAPEEPAPEVREVSFARDIAPIFDAKCIDCHHPGNAVKVDLTAVFDPDVGIVGRPNSWPASSRPVLVVAGNPDASALMLKIEETDLEPKVEGNPMPWYIPRLTDTELSALRTWIENGAEDDELFRDSVRRVFGDGVSLGSRGGKCTYCHYESSRTGLNLVNPFDPIEGAVTVASHRGGSRIDPGSPETSAVYLRVDPNLITPELEPLMPLHVDRITENEADLIRRWIEEGARNN